MKKKEGATRRNGRKWQKEERARRGGEGDRGSKKEFHLALCCLSFGWVGSTGLEMESFLSSCDFLFLPFFVSLSRLPMSARPFFFLQVHPSIHPFMLPHMQAPLWELKERVYLKVDKRKTRRGGRALEA
mmetsp:Transcript_8960/g.17483  ORF Transcript_8960/g.17483 Transcript_8960/m.17483 type:complete len:129 (+) Transcript_8960:2965-3351(+)